MRAPTLAEQQAALYAVLRDRAAGHRACVASSTLRFGPDAARRLDVYHRAYFARLRACLEDDFPRVRARLGPDAFTALAADYVEADPPRDPALRNLGRGLSAFIERRWPDRRDLVDLARLEWAWVEVFDAPDQAQIAAEAVQAIAPEAWGDLVFDVLDAHRLLETRFPVHAVADDPAAPLPEPKPSTVLVWRRDLRVFVREVEPAEAAALTAVAGGAPFAEWCTSGDEEVTAAAQRAVRWLNTWLEEGLLVGLRAA